jgi:ribosome-binding factor A
MVKRTDRVSEEIKKAVSDIIKNEMRDPRAKRMVSVTGAEVTKDFAHAKVYYSVLCDGEDEARALDAALRNAAGFVRRSLGARLALRRVPEVRFVRDMSIERSVSMNRLISETIAGDEGLRAKLGAGGAEEGGGGEGARGEGEGEG